MIVRKREEGDVAIFDVEGEIRRSLTAGPTLHELVKFSLDEGSRNILLNFEKVDFVDSFGVGEILASYISIQNSGGRLKLFGISNKLLLIFQVTMLTKVLDIQDSEETALRSFSTS